jgi:hypothetical protein
MMVGCHRPTVQVQVEVEWGLLPMILLHQRQSCWSVNAFC